jgi:hypothetical protein
LKPPALDRFLELILAVEPKSLDNQLAVFNLEDKQLPNYLIGNNTIITIIENQLLLYPSQNHRQANDVSQKPINMSVRGITKEALVRLLEKEQVEGSLGLFTDAKVCLPGGLASYISGPEYFVRLK